MKKFFKFPFYFFCVSLLGISGYLLVKPISVYAASCDGNCSNGTVISVSGTACGCGGGICGYWTQQGGGYMYTKRCP
jgi:hypothetical protein